MTTSQVTISTDAESLKVITSDLASSIYVEAGAGTGKTHSLVERIIALLKDGVPIEQIMAITFTRAAASELRSRIRGRLEEIRAEDPSNSNIDNALDGIDTAAFQTIDSLVHSILQEHPLDAGLPPSIDAQDKFAQLQMFRDRWRQWSVEQLEQDEAFAEALSSALRLKLANPFQSASELAKLMNEKHGETKTAVFEPPPRKAKKTVAGLEDQIDGLRRMMGNCKDPQDKLFEKFEKVIDWYDEYIQGQDVETENDAEELLVNWIGTTFGNSGTQSNWGGRDGKEAAGELLDEFDRSIDQALSSARESVTLKLYAFANRFVETVVDERRRAGSVSYYDAITWLIDTLETRPDIRQSVQNRYRRILVDEFQDTDPKQVKLVRLLAIPPRQDRVIQGSLFIVGDPKQSIYRFRGAEVQVSQAVKQDIIGSSGKHLTLMENRRSSRPIINWVNQVFGRWMPSEDGQADWIPLARAAETATPHDFGKVFHFGEDHERTVIDEVRQIDADEVAKIARAVCSGALTVRDRHDGHCRPSHAGDLTILTRSRSSWDIYTRALDDFDLPYSAELGGAAVLNTQEVRDLLNCLTAMDDPSDQPATVGALKSIYFGCSDRDLFDWARAGGVFSCTANIPEQLEASNVGSAMTTLREYHELRDEIQPAVLVERFIRERRAREVMYLDVDPMAGLRRLDLAVELTRRFNEEDANSLRECLRRFQQFRESDEDLREEPSLEFDQGKIRLMTMHASKGLEFPIVILADLSGSRNSDSPKLLISTKVDNDSASEIAVRLGGGEKNRFETNGYEVLKERNSVDDELEKTRILYVAATRARDYLVVSRNRNRNRRSYAAKIEQHTGGDNSELWSPIPSEWAALANQPVDASASRTSPRKTLDRDTWRQEHDAIMRTASARGWISPSSLKEATVEDTISEDEKPDDTPIGDSEGAIGRGRAATKVGSAVHAAVQRCLENPDVNSAQVAASEAAKHGVSDHANEVAHLTKVTLAMPLLRDFASKRREDFWVETPVAVSIPTEDGSTSSVIEGRVDLIYRLADGSLGISDFKTDRTFNRSIAEMAEPYIPQLGAYAYAVQKATGMAVTEASILFSRLAADKPGDGEYRLPNVQSAIELALKLASDQ